MQLAATAGPMRRFAARIFVRTIPSTAQISTIKLVEGKNVPMYVRVVPSRAALGSRRVTFTEGGPGTEQTGVSMILPDEGAFECIVMPGEALFGTVVFSEGGGVPFQGKVYEVRV